MTLADRVREMIGEKGLSQEQLAEKANTSQGTISNILNGTTKRPRNIVDIAYVLGVEPQWLQDGIGNKYSGMSAMPIIEVEQEDDTIVIDVLDVEASAGYGSQGDLVQVVKQLRYVPEQYYALYPGMNPENTRVINVKGDSMLPTFQHTDLLFVDITTDYFDGDGVYVFTFENFTYVKRLQKAGREMFVISDNEAYEKWVIKAEDGEQLYIHGKVKVHQSQRLNLIG